MLIIWTHGYSSTYQIHIIVFSIYFLTFVFFGVHVKNPARMSPSQIFRATYFTLLRQNKCVFQHMRTANNQNQHAKSDQNFTACYRTSRYCRTYQRIARFLAEGQISIKHNIYLSIYLPVCLPVCLPAYLGTNVPMHIHKKRTM